jgi:hypothetical protein
MKAKELLEVYKATVVRAMLEHAGQPVTTLKAINISRLEPVLKDAGRIKRELASLSRAEKVAISRIHEKNDLIRYERLNQILALDDVVAPLADNQKGREADPDYRGKPTSANLLAGLARKALVFSREPQRPNQTVIEWTPGKIVFIPDFISRLLPDDLAPDLPDLKTTEPPHIVTSSARNFQRDLGRYGRYLRLHGQIPLTSQGLVYKKTLKEIAENLSFTVDLGSGKGEEENRRLYFIRRLLPKVGLAKFTGDALVPHANDEQFWSLEPLARVRQTFEAWRDKGAWNELRYLESYERGYDRQHDAPTGLVGSRRVVLKQIKEMGTGWVSLTELIEEIRARDYGFLFSQRKHSSYWYYSSGLYTTPYHAGNNAYGISFRGVTTEAEGWNKVEAALISHLISQPLFWMGLVDLGYLQPLPQGKPVTRQPDAYRLTDMGAWLLGLAKPVQVVSEGGGIVVQPNFEILAMEPVSDEVLLTLDKFADPKGGDRVLHYELNRASVYRGQQQEWSVPRIITYLETAVGRPLPDNVRRSLEEWEALHRRITIRQGVNLIHTLNEDVRRQIEQTVIGRQLRPLGDNVLLADTPVAAIDTSLREAGWLPVQTPAGQTGAPNSVDIDGDGRIRYTHRLPSIYAQGAVAPLSVEASPEHDQGANRRIIPSLVKAVLGQGESIPNLLSRLRAVNRGELPPALILKIKAWGNYYGDAQQARLILIEFRDAAAHQELLADPELKDYLTPFKAGNRPLAVVHPEHVDEVNRLLAERGVEVREGLR